MAKNAIDRLKDRQRKKVNPRNASLNVATEPMTESSQTTNQSSSNDSIAESGQITNQSDSNDLMTESSQTTNQSDSNDSIAESGQTTNQSSSNDLMTESGQTTNQSSSNDLMTESSQTTNQSSSNDLMAEAYCLQEPIRRTVRLDPQVDEYMDVLCKENRVTRETLIEAAMVICSKNQRTLNKVITDAKDRYKDRKRRGELKKLQTMSQKLKGM